MERIQELLNQLGNEIYDQLDSQYQQLETAAVAGIAAGGVLLLLVWFYLLLRPRKIARKRGHKGMGWLFLMLNVFGLGNPFTWFFTVLAARKLEDKSVLPPRAGAHKLTLPAGLKKPAASGDSDSDSSGEVPAIPQVKLPSGGPTKPAPGGVPSMKAKLAGGGPKLPGNKETAVTTSFPRRSHDSDATEILGRKAVEVKVKVRCGMCGKGFAGPKRVVDALRACPKCGADPLSFEFL